MRLAVSIGAAALALGVPGCGQHAPRAPAERATQSLGAGGPFQATLTISPTAITTAQRISARVEARLGPGAELADFDAATALPEGFEIVNQSSDRRAIEGGGSVVIREWTIEPFLAGEYEIGSLVIAVKGRPESEALRSEPVKITVASVLKEGESELAEAKPVVDPPFEVPAWAWWAAGGAALGIAGLAWLIAARRRRAAMGPEPVYVPAHTLALQRLAALMQRRLVEAGRFDDFYTEASQILRRYIEDRFGLHAPERTTEEFLVECRASSRLLPDDEAILKTFLGHCDMVKFAAVIPSTPEAEGVAATVRRFIERTQDAVSVVQVEETTA